jgi:hypothetical protein
LYIDLLDEESGERRRTTRREALCRASIAVRHADMHALAIVFVTYSSRALAMRHASTGPYAKRNGPVPSAREREGTGPNDAARSKGRNVRY